MTMSAPAKRELTSVPTEVEQTSISPARSACETMGLALMLMISASRPCFCNNFFSCIIQIALLAGLTPAQAMRILSWALIKLARLRNAADAKNSANNFRIIFVSCSCLRSLALSRCSGERPFDFAQDRPVAATQQRRYRSHVSHISVQFCKNSNLRFSEKFDIA